MINLMNVFYLDSEVKRCAMYHNDRHVVKMIVEYAQLLSTAHRVLDGRPSPSGEKFLLLPGERVDNTPQGLDIVYRKCYKQTHVNHPSNVWVRNSQANYLWLLELLKNLHDEWRYRYDHTNETHKSFQIISFLSSPPANIANDPFEPPPLAMPDEFKLNDAVESYRNYYMKGKAHLAAWKKRPVPDWYKA